MGALGAGQVGQKLGGRETLRITAILYVALRHRLRPGLELVLLHVLPLHRRAGHRRLLRSGARVHRRAFAGQVARAAGGRFQFNVVFGILVAYTSNYFIRTLHLGAAEWRWQVGVAAIPALGFLALLFGIPRSPRWSAAKNRNERSPRRAQA